MYIYVVNLISIFFYSWFYNFTKRKYNLKKYLVSLMSAQLVLILALRDNTVGVDVDSYFGFFTKMVPNFSIQDFFNHRFEFGYKFLNKILSYITSNEQVFLAIIAIISIIPVGRFIYKYSKMPFLSYGLYIAFNFYSFTFSGLRQAIAFGIILISYDYIVKKKMTSFVISVLLATLFHRTAFIFYFAYILTKVQINKKILSVIIAINFVIYITRIYIFEIVIIYLFDSYDIVETGAGNWIILSTFIISISLLFYKKVTENDSSKNILYMLVIVGVSLMLFSTIGSNVMRMANYYYIFMIILIPEVLSSIKNKMFFLFAGYILIIGIFSLHIWFLSYSDTYQMIPYRFFW